MKHRHPILFVAAIIFFSTFCAAASYCQLPPEIWEHAWNNAMVAVGIDRAGDVYESDGTNIYCMGACNGAIKWTGITGANVIACDKANGIVTDLGDAYESNGILHASRYPGGTGVAIDSSGNVIFISGGTIKKYNSAGALLWSQTYFGASSGIAVSCDGNDNIYAALNTTVSSLATSGAYQTSVGPFLLAKLSSSGALLWATYYLSDTTSSSSLYALAVSKNGNVYFAGCTSESGAATSGAYQTVPVDAGHDAILGRFDKDGKRKWVSYYSTGSGPEALKGIAVSPSEKLAACGIRPVVNISQGGFGCLPCIGEPSYSEILIALDSSGNNFSGGIYDANLLTDECGCGTGGTLNAIAADRFGFAVVGFLNSGSSPSDGGAGCSGDCSGGSEGWDARFADDYGYGTGASISSTKSDTVCQGDAVILSIDYTYPPYHWRLNGALISGATSKTYTPNTSTPGTRTYSCDLVPQAGNLCPQPPDYALTVIAPPHIDTITISGSTPCPGIKVQLIPTITGTDPYYSWSPVSTLDNPHSATPRATVGKDSVTYTLVVSNGCSSASKTVTVIPSSILSGGGTRTICPGTSTVLTVNVTGANPISYSWQPIYGLNNWTSGSVIATPTASTTYTVSVINSEGCTLTETFTVLIDPYLNMSVKADSMWNSICPGESIRLRSTVSGGTKPYSYLWSPSTGLNNHTLSNCVAAPSKTTTYHLRVTDFYGCSREDSSLTITVWSVPKFLKQQDTIKVCPIAVMPIGHAAQGGTPPYLYHWINSAGQSLSKWDTSHYLIVKADTTTTYTEEVKDVHDCLWTQETFVILVGSSPSKPAISPGDTITCWGIPVHLHASKGYALYRWNDGSTADSLTATSEGKYYVTVFNENGCQNTSDTVTIRTVQVTPDVEGPSSVCPQSVSSYLAKVVKGDRLGWTLNGGGSIRATSHPDSIDVQWNTFGTWVLTANDTNTYGCIGTSSITVKVNSTLSPVITPNGNIPICQGQSVVLRAEKGYQSYKWSDGNTADSLIVKQAGSYSVHVVGKGGCSGSSDVVIVTVSQIPVVSIVAVGSTHLCNGNTLNLSASDAFDRYLWNTGDTTATIAVSHAGIYSLEVTNAAGCTGKSAPVTIDSGGYHPQISGPLSLCINEGPAVYRVPKDTTVTYHWSAVNGTITSGQGSDSVTIQWNDAAAGSGTLTLIDSIFGGCLDTTLATITIDASLHPLVTANGPLGFCQGDSVLLDAGSGFASYQWLKDGVSIPGAVSEKFSVAQSGNYSAVVTNSSCTGTSEGTMVTVFPLPNPVITQGHDTLFTTFGVSYQWFMNSQPILSEVRGWIVPLTSGSYSVTVTDSNGCSGTSLPIQITVQNNVLPPSAIVRIGLVPPVNPGKAFEVPIELVSSQNLLSTAANHYAGTLRYNGTMLEPTSSRGGTVGTSSAVGETTDRIIGFEGFSFPVTSGTLQWIECNAALGNDSCTLLALDTFYWTDANVAVNRQNGSFCESGLCSSGGRILLIDPSGHAGIRPPYPNPARDHIVIEYDLVETGRTKLALIDLIGRPALIISDNDQKAGHYQVEVPITTIAPGFYLTFMKTPSQVFWQPLTIQK